ncbi:hypothetical protein [Halobaculum magnesiiphilum]|uniref:Uncharacterized protein n=1 Tax=Halobaculum magnesiiphilum TaxID=1017351 RepID=A0A8T8WCY0_9EURY|nr:hypothetical protein [Halobaculum magnesiiphilum]QZP37695.1 hypothetical protein K6T50_00490 [Halobaculum magnesiiphilum]
MSVSNRVPDPLKGPLGAASLGVMILGLVVGYIFTMLGVTLVLNLNGIQGISDVEALTVTATGLACIVAGYFGWKGFMGFAY